MKKQYETIMGAVFAIEDNDGTHAGLYDTIRDGLKRPTYTKRIGDEMKLEETEFEGNKKIYVITKITTIDYTKFQLETRLKPKK
jgi:hypothetical protein